MKCPLLILTGPFLNSGFGAGGVPRLVKADMLKPCAVAIFWMGGFGTLTPATYPFTHQSHTG